MGSIRESTGDTIVDDLVGAGFQRGGLLALAVAPGTGLGVAVPAGWSAAIATESPVEVVRRIEDALRPRWVLWGAEVSTLVDADVRVAKCWHVVAVQRLLVGGWRMDAARAWAQLHDLSVDGLPVAAPVDLFTDPDDSEPDQPMRADGYLKPEWLANDFDWTPERIVRWAQLAAEAAMLQDQRLGSSLIARWRGPSLVPSRLPSCCVPNSLTTVCPWTAPRRRRSWRRSSGLVR